MVVGHGAQLCLCCACPRWLTLTTPLWPWGRLSTRIGLALNARIAPILAVVSLSLSVRVMSLFFLSFSSLCVSVSLRIALHLFPR